jgi:hypothetical protein
VIRAHKGIYQLVYFQVSYGAIIDGLNTDTWIGLYWNPLNLIRWALTTIVLVFLNKYSFAQILILLVISVIFKIMLLTRNPMADKWDQRITWIIELSISIYLYVLLSLTDFMGESTLRDEKGWILTILTGTAVIINVLIFFWKSFWRVFAYIKQKFGNLFIEKARTI